MALMTAWQAPASASQSKAGFKARRLSRAPAPTISFALPEAHSRLVRSNPSAASHSSSLMASTACALPTQCERNHHAKRTRGLVQPCVKTGESRRIRQGDRQFLCSRQLHRVVAAQGERVCIVSRTFHHAL